MSNYRVDKKFNGVNLPQCLMEEEIFSRLPIKTLMRFKSLSKQWYSVLSSAQFAQLHQKYHGICDGHERSLVVDTRGSIHILDWGSFDDSNKNSLRLFKGTVKSTGFDPRSVQFVGSCRGLVCSYHGMDYFFVWNPTTQNSRKISGYSSFGQNNTVGILDIALIIRGFGYVSSIDDYKIVEIQVLTSLRTSSFKISVLKLKGGEWEDVTVNKNDVVVDASRFNLWHKCYVRPGAAPVDEILHWLVDINKNYTHILAFDMAADKLQYHTIRLPETYWGKYDAFLSVVKQRLCLCSKFQSFIEMCVLRDLKWQKHIKVDLGTNIVGAPKFSEWNLFGCSKTDALKIVVRPCDGRSHFVVDLSDCRTKQTVLPHQLYISFAVSFIESLVYP